MYSLVAEVERKGWFSTINNFAYSSRNGLLDESTQLNVFKEASYSVIDI